MFPFFRKKEVAPEAPRLKTDLHSHLIPGIDDGSQSIEESLSLLKGLVALGYERVITTPHIMSDAYRNTPQIIRKGLAELREASARAGLDITIDAAAEYYFDESFIDLLAEGEMMTFNGNFLLFETSYISKPLRTEEMIFEITSAGYIPVMAHPERYRYIKEPFREYNRFKELGVRFQVNLNSFGGHYGKSAKSLANILSKNGMIDFLGSDVHHQKHVETLGNVLHSDTYREIFSHNKIGNNTLA
jgi:tyrosine-protein phosphatase YwqE